MTKTYTGNYKALASIISYNSVFKIMPLFVITRYILVIHLPIYAAIDHGIYGNSSWWITRTSLI